MIFSIKKVIFGIIKVKKNSFFQCGPEDLTLTLMQPESHFEFETPALGWFVVSRFRMCFPNCVFLAITFVGSIKESTRKRQRNVENVSIRQHKVSTHLKWERNKLEFHDMSGDIASPRGRKLHELSRNKFSYKSRHFSEKDLKTNERTPGVNFTNILRAAFSYEC